MLSIVRKVCRNIRLPKNMGGAQYLLHPPCGVIYNLIFLISASLQRTLFLLAGQVEPAAARSIICFDINTRLGNDSYPSHFFSLAYAFFAVYGADFFVQNRL